MSCTTCGSTQLDRYLRASVGTVLQCRSCRVVFLSPEEQKSKQADSLYAKEYFTEREGYFFHDGVADGTGHESPHIEDFRLGLELITGQVRPPGRLLDVGCATGSFLSLAKASGWDCRGVEVSSFAAAQARERTGCEVFCGQFGEAPFADGTFDVITMWDLLEHLPDPITALRKARALLRADGLLLVNTPNEDSLTRMVARFLYHGTGGWLQAPVNRLYHHYHLYYFSAATLSPLFGQAGFDLIALKTKPIPISRGRISPATKVVMHVLSAVERVVRAEYELIILARRRA
jgi:2-polyprenyl-3-methyl-5-hydroxy-6-metoxy-1,4-benzoquinol methylase